MFDVRLTLTTRNGRQGVQMLRADQEMKWNVQSGDDETINAQFDYVLRGRVTQSVVIGGDDWRALEDAHEAADLVKFLDGGCDFAHSISAMCAGEDPDGWNDGQNRDEEIARLIRQRDNIIAAATRLLVGVTSASTPTCEWYDGITGDATGELREALGLPPAPELATGQPMSTNIIEALKAAAAYVELYTPNGTREQPPAWAVLPNGDFDAEAIANRARAALQEDPWHLFYIEAGDTDGEHAYIVSAQSGSEIKAQELAENAVLDEVGTADEPGSIEHTERLGCTDSDVFLSVGLLAA
jgi:hypothetical protein